MLQRFVDSVHCVSYMCVFPLSEMSCTQYLIFRADARTNFGD